MALDFPSAPTDGQLYAGANGVVYQWSASKGLWLSTPQAIQNLGLGDFIAYGSGAPMAPPSAGVWFAIKPATILTGNSGSWYNSTTGRFTPPAGRYRLFGELTFNSSGQSIQGLMRWTKNGATILPSNSDSSQDTSAANKFGSVTSETIIDANGTDYFECHVQSWTVLFSVAYGYIGAMPLGVVVAMNNGFRLIQRLVSPGGINDMSIRNIPSDINDLMFSFDVANGTNAQDLVLQYYDATNTLINAGGSYASIATVQIHTANNSAPGSMGSVVSTITSGIMMSYPGSTRRVHTSGIRGRGGLANIRGTTQNRAADAVGTYISDDAAVLCEVRSSGYRGAFGAVSGLRLAWGGGTFTAGSVFSVWGSP